MKSQNRNKLTVIIPAYNEGKTITKVIKSVLEQNCVSQVIVVNDGSKDNTKIILDNIRNNKVRVFHHNKNRGKGAAIITALRFVKGDFVLIQDADLEYSPKEYINLYKHSDKNKVIYGSRLLKTNPKAYFSTYIGNVLLTNFCNLLFGTKLTDSYTCYKLMPTKIAKSLNLTSRGFEVEAEITAKLAKKGIPIEEIPISYKPRSYQQGKKIKTKDALAGIKTFLRVYFK